MRGRKRWSLEPGCVLGTEAGEGRGKRAYGSTVQMEGGLEAATCWRVWVKLGMKWRQKRSKALQVEKSSDSWEEEMTHLAHPMVALQLATMVVGGVNLLTG